MGFPGEGKYQKEYVPAERRFLVVNDWILVIYARLPVSPLVGLMVLGRGLVVMGGLEMMDGLVMIGGLVVVGGGQKRSNLSLYSIERVLQMTAHVVDSDL